MTLGTCDGAPEFLHEPDKQRWIGEIRDVRSGYVTRTEYSCLYVGYAVRKFGDVRGGGQKF